jgi:hypothetical protein
MASGQRHPADTHGYGAAAVTPDDDNDLTRSPSRDLYIGTGGTLKVTTSDGSVVSFGNVVPGRLGIGVKRVWSTGTSATNIVALY